MNCTEQGRIQDFNLWGRVVNGMAKRHEGRSVGRGIASSPEFKKKFIIVLRPGMGNREGKGGGSPSQPTRGLGGAS